MVSGASWTVHLNSYSLALKGLGVEVRGRPGVMTLLSLEQVPHTWDHRRHLHAVVPMEGWADTQLVLWTMPALQHRHPGFLESFTPCCGLQSLSFLYFGFQQPEPVAFLQRTLWATGVTLPAWEELAMPGGLRLPQNSP